MFPTIDKQRTGQRIRMLMKQQNITVKQIQEYLNLSCVQGIYHWLDGTSMPTVDNLYALSELFEVPMDYIMEKEFSVIAIIFVLYLTRSHTHR